MNKTAIVLILVSATLLTACDAKRHAPQKTYLTDAGELLLPDCPDWSEAHIGNFANTLHSNHGCAHAVNHTLMLETPYDLIENFTDHRPDSERAFGIIQDYRSSTGAATGTGSSASIGGSGGGL